MDATRPDMHRRGLFGHLPHVVRNPTVASVVDSSNEGLNQAAFRRWSLLDDGAMDERCVFQ